MLSALCGGGNSGFEVISISSEATQLANGRSLDLQPRCQVHSTTSSSICSHAIIVFRLHYICSFEKQYVGDFPGNPVVKNLSCNTGDASLTPSSRSLIPAG